MNSWSPVEHAALGYWQEGFQPVPIQDDSKRPPPELGDWTKFRVTSEDDIRKHFSNGNGVGIKLGEPSGDLVDIDLDTPEAVVASRWFLPETKRIHGRPGSLSSHRWYRSPSSRTRQFKFRDKMIVELRSTGAQTVAPPSKHPSGEKLTWEVNGEPTQVEANELSRAVAKVAACSVLAAHWPEEGHRHDAANALAGWLVREEFSVKEAESFIVALSRTVGHPRDDYRRAAHDTARKIDAGQPTTGGGRLRELVGEDVVSKAAEWLELGSGHYEDSGNIESSWEPPIPFDFFELPDFPVDALPESLRDFVRAEAEFTQTPVELPAFMALAVVSTSLARKVEVLVKPGYTEPVNIFALVAQPPGARKSQVFKDVAAPLERYEARELRRVEPEIARAHEQQRLIEARIQECRKRAAKTDDPAERENLTSELMGLTEQLRGVSVPTCPRFSVDDITPERLVTHIREQGGRIAVLSPEGDIFDLMAGRYSSSGIPNFGVFLRGHAGDDIRVDRVNRSSEFVRRPALTMGLAVQPEVLIGLVDKPGFRGRGLLGRFLYALPRDLLGRRRVDTSPVPEAVRADYERTVLTLLALREVRDHHGEPAPHILRLAPEGERQLREFDAWVEPQLSEFGDLGSINDWGGKLTGAVARLAGILHMVEHAELPTPLPISDRTVQAAIKIGHYLIPHAKAAFQQMGADPEVEAAKHVLRWIERSGRKDFSKRDAFQGTKGRFKRVEKLEPALEILAKHDYIRELPRRTEPGPGRKKSPTFRVNPFAQKSQYSQNSGMQPGFGNSEDILRLAPRDV